MGAEGKAGVRWGIGASGMVGSKDFYNMRNVDQGRRPHLDRSPDTRLRSVLVTSYFHTVTQFSFQVACDLNRPFR